MSDEYGSDLVLPFLQIFGVGQNIIQSRGVLVSKLGTRIPHVEVLTNLDGGHVFANFFYSSERDDADVVANFGQGEGLGGFDHGRSIVWVVEAAIGVVESWSDEASPSGSWFSLAAFSCYIDAWVCAWRSKTSDA